VRWVRFVDGRFRRFFAFDVTVVTAQSRDFEQYETFCKFRDVGVIMFLKILAVCAIGLFFV